MAMCQRVLDTTHAFYVAAGEQCHSGAASSLWGPWASVSLPTLGDQNLSLVRFSADSGRLTHSVNSEGTDE